MPRTSTSICELHPFFHVFGDPFFAPPSTNVAQTRSCRGQNRQVHHRHRGSSISEAGFGGIRKPRVQVMEERTRYTVKAEVPGVRKENLDVSIGDGGRSLCIQGNSTLPASVRAEDSGVHVEAPGETPADASMVKTTASGDVKSDVQPAAVAQDPTEKQDVETKTRSRGRSTLRFSCTVWLPQPVDPARIVAKLDHGILLLDIPKREEVKEQKIIIE
ncbi:hypothetical protein FRB93_009086 [Tulasnella sp. JGI-2019a]|nr:hypothetical protein FRB93_009086 [Tulasnella sp. JGI-2019a]